MADKMKFKLCFLVALVSVLAINSCFAQAKWELKYGKEMQEVGFYNSNNSKDFAEDAPFGPMAFRVMDKKLWVLDSVRSRLIGLDQNNNLFYNLKVKNTPDNVMLEDFAFYKAKNGKVEYVWIAEGAENSIRKISTKTGQEKLKIGTRGKESGKFLQIHQLEVDSTGRIYVGDIGKSVIAVFSPYGDFIREIPWQGTDFLLDKDDSLVNLFYSAEIGYQLKTFSKTGNLISSVQLGFCDHKNGRLITQEASGNLILAFIPPGGFKGKLQIFRVSPSGAILKQSEFKPTAVMNRFLAVDGDEYYVARADFYAAPKGKIEIEQLNWETKK